MDQPRRNGLDDALERLVTDPGFRELIAADPQAALDGFDLTTEELGVLASAIGGDDEGGERGVEARQSKAGMLGLFAPVMGGGGRGADEVGFNPQPDPPGLPLRGEDAGIIIYGQPGEDSGIIIIGGRDGG